MALAALAAAFVPGAAAEGLPGTIRWNSAKLERTRERLRHEGSPEAPALSALIVRADAAARRRPASVVEKSELPPSGDIHDYFSLATYYWPDPESPGGLPYVPRDGEVNPENKDIPDAANLGRLLRNVRDLALAYRFTGKERYAASAVAALRVFFLDPATKMNPHLGYAQWIRGRGSSRGVGIIDAREFCLLPDALALLEAYPGYPAEDKKGLADWLGAYLDWLSESPDGRAEAGRRNNHGTWYMAQAAALALRLGRRGLASRIFDSGLMPLLSAQFRPDGSQPEELGRTRALHYSLFNLEAWFHAAALGRNLGYDLFRAETPTGAGIKTGLDFLLPFILGARSFPYRQITPLPEELALSLLMEAKEVFGETKYAEAVESFPKAKREAAVERLLF